MTQYDREAELRKELDEFNREKDRVRTLIGSIGGKAYNRMDAIINIVFMVLIAVLFILELTTKLLPVFISIELGILLVSIKIVWMIHNHNKFYHFQFWILNSIEFRISDMVKRIRSFEEAVRDDGGE